MNEDCTPKTPVETRQHISDVIGAPIVGRIYMVPCVRLANDWWPVQGSVHADKDLGVATRHIHYDGRFLTSRQVYVNLVTIRRTERLGAASPPLVPCEDEAIQLVHQIVPEDLIIARPRRCRRAAMEFPANYVQAILEPRFSGAVAVDCRTCPHQGARLDQQPAGEDGGVVCPGHGLKWHRKTGRMMPRARP